MRSFLLPFLIAGMLGAQSVPGVVTSSLPLQRVVVVRLKNKTDLLRGLQDAVDREHIQNAVILSGFGSVTSYHKHVVGNVTLPPKDVFTQDNGPYDLVGVGGMIMSGRVHAHITLAATANTVAGHLEPGTSVFTFAVVSLGVLGDSADLSRFDDWNWR